MRCRQKAAGRAGVRINWDEREQHFQDEQKVRRETARQEQESGEYSSRVATYGEHLAQVSRQVRHTYQRRNYSP